LEVPQKLKLLNLRIELRIHFAQLGLPKMKVLFQEEVALFSTPLTPLRSLKERTLIRIKESKLLEMLAEFQQKLSAPTQASRELLSSKNFLKPT